jgi:hypothetical protein
MSKIEKRWQRWGGRKEANHSFTMIERGGMEKETHL